MLVTVSSFREPYEAHLFRGRLQAEGILAFVASEMHVANKWYLAHALGGVRVQVSSDEIELAREVEQACRDGVFHRLLREEIGDLDDPECPRCGGTEFRKRRPFPRAALAIAASLTFAVVIPPAGWILSCEACGRSFRAPHRPFSWPKAALVAATMIGVVAFEMALLHWIETIIGCPPSHACF
jgi:hypothetical protein